MTFIRFDHVLNCDAAGLTYNVSFEGFPATSATIAVRSIALRGCLAKDIAISATSEVVAIRVQQQSVKVSRPVCRYLASLHFSAALVMFMQADDQHSRREASRN